MAAWVDKQAHVGNKATSRVERIHGLLKLYLRRSTFDLFEAWKSIRLALDNQLSELRSNQAKQQIRTPLELDKAIYRAVQGWVSHEALRKVEEQRQLQWKEPPPSLTCTGTFTRVWGLPCLHVLDMRQGEPLRLEDFYSHCSPYLLGIFGVFMPLIYGEGEIMRSAVSDDTSRRM